MGIIKYRQKSKNIVKLKQYLEKKYVHINKHIKQINK